MLSFIVNRVAHSLVVAWIISAIVFFGMYVVADPIDSFLPEDATAADEQAFIEAYNLDKPALVQYGSFLIRLVQGDLGISFNHGEPVLDLILDRLPATLELAVIALAFALLIGIPLGIFSGLNPRTKRSKATMFLTTIGYSVPNFWQGIVLILVFAVTLRLLPAGGRGDTATFLGAEWAFLTLDGWRHMALPVINLAIYKICMHTRLARSGTRETKTQEFMTFAKAKGIADQTLIRSHLLPNILIPIVTITGLEFGALIAFSTVTETVFSWPGLGKLLIDSIKLGDQPVVTAYLVLISFMFVTINLIVDVVYALIDPRIRYSAQG
ncbi:MAG: ABC transporter permease [Cohaesibacter sp.]|nr:ABC transporter permease [Cohaesibacter sp.]